MSALYLAAAVRDNGGGTVIGSELLPQKVNTARCNLAEARPRLVDQREGDARPTFRDLGVPNADALNKTSRFSRMLWPVTRSMSSAKHGAVHRPGSHLFLWRKDFLNTDLVNEMLATQVSQVSSLLLIGQVCTDAVDHYHDESAIIHIELVLAVPDEWTVKVG